jgi:hypothetical protein
LGSNNTYTVNVTPDDTATNNFRITGKLEAFGVAFSSASPACGVSFRWRIETLAHDSA